MCQLSLKTLGITGWWASRVGRTLVWPQLCSGRGALCRTPQGEEDRGHLDLRPSPRLTCAVAISDPSPSSDGFLSSARPSSKSLNPRVTSGMAGPQQPANMGNTGLGQEWGQVAPWATTLDAENVHGETRGR